MFHAILNKQQLYGHVPPISQVRRVRQNELCCRSKDELKSVVLISACDVMDIVIGNGHGDTSSNPGLDWLLFT